MYLSLVSLIEKLKKEPPIPTIWGPIKKGTFGFVYGRPKSGKTIFCENLAMSLAYGSESFFNIPITKDVYKVLFISLEEFSRHRTERNAKQISRFIVNEENQDSFIVVSDDFPKYIIDKEEIDILEKTLRDTGANIVFIDSLTRIGKGEIEQSDTAKKIAGYLKELARRMDITLIIIHHAPKLGGNPITIDNLAGSHVLAQEADFILGINMTYDGTRYFKEVANRYRQEKEEITIFKINDSLCVEPGNKTEEWRLFKTEDGRASDENMSLIFETMNELAEDDLVDNKMLTDELFGKKRIAKSTYYDNIQKLELKGKVEKLKNNKYRIIRNTQTQRINLN